MGRCESLVHWNHSFDMWLSYLGPEFRVSSGLAVAAVWWLLDGRYSFLSEFPLGSRVHHPRWLQLLMTVTYFMYWFGRNYSISPLPWWLHDKESACRCRRHSFHPWVRKIPWRWKWQPTPVFWPGESHGWRSLADYSPLGHREST